ncbi:hypothetical protein GEMRC1_014037 [Eukaryota sp. GEM-RC1]
MTKTKRVLVHCNSYPTTPSSILPSLTLEYKTRVGVAFLREFSSSFQKDFPSANTAQPGSLNRGVKSIAQALKEKFESPERVDSILAAQAELDATTQLMQDNVLILAERGEKVDSLLGRSETMAAESGRYYSNATTLKRIMWWRNFKLTLIMGVFGVSVLGYIGLSFVDV